MADLPDATTLDNYAFLQDLIKKTVLKIKADLIHNIKMLAGTANNRYTIIVSSFLPSPDQVGEDYNSVLLEVCEAVCQMLLAKNYEIETDVSKNSTYSITLTWRKKAFEGKCQTFTKYLKNDSNRI